MKFHNIQALRGIAALLVVLFHISQWEELWRTSVQYQFMKPFQSFAYCGVDIFFVISGFIITYVSYKSFGESKNLPSYIFKRFWRIYPPLWLAMIVAVVMLHPPPHWLLFIKLEAPKLIQTALLIPHPVKNLILLPQSWSLCCEIIFYFVFPLFFFLPKKYFMPSIIFWLSSVIGLSVFNSVKINPFIDQLFNPFNAHFCLGSLAALALFQNFRLKSIYPAIVSLFLFVFALFINSIPNLLMDIIHSPSFRFLEFGFPSALLIYSLTKSELEGFQLPHLLSPLGAASYSIYLLHIPALEFMKNLLLKVPSSPLGEVFWLSSLFIGSLSIGSLFYLFIEKPLMKIGTIILKTFNSPSVPTDVVKSTIPEKLSIKV